MLAQGKEADSQPFTPNGSMALTQESGKDDSGK